MELKGILISLVIANLQGFVLIVLAVFILLKVSRKTDHHSSPPAGSSSLNQRNRSPSPPHIQETPAPMILPTPPQNVIINQVNVATSGGAAEITRNQCKGTTKEGNRCKRQIQGDHCLDHQP